MVTPAVFELKPASQDAIPAEVIPAIFGNRIKLPAQLKLDGARALLILEDVNRTPIVCGFYAGCGHQLQPVNAMAYQAVAAMSAGQFQVAAVGAN